MPLFTKYEADPEVVRAAGQKAVDQDAALRETGDTAVRRAQRAASETSGLLPAETSTVSDQTRDDAYALGSASLLAGGALKTFAHAIDDYNTGIASLNERWDEAVGNDFGVAADAGSQPDMTPAEADAARAGEVSAAREALRSQLESEERTLSTDLEDAGDQSASLLSKGPSSETLGYLAMTGTLPPAGLMAHLSLSTAELNTLVTFGKMLGKGFKLGKSFYQFANILAGTDLRAAIKLIDQDFAQMMSRMDDLQGDDMLKLKVWMQDNADFLARSGQLTDAASEARLARITNLLYNGTKFSKGMGVLGVVGGGLQVYDTIANWDELSVKDRTLGMTGGITGFAAGAGTLALAAGFAIPVVGQVALVGAGLVSAGIAIYQNWDTITDVAGDVWNNVGDFASDTGENIADLAQGAGDAISGAVDGAADTISDAADDVGDAIGDAAEGVGDFFGF